MICIMLVLLDLDMMNLVLLDCCVLQGLMLELGPAGLIEEKDDLIIVRYALIKKTILFGNFSQHGGGASQIPKLL